jgi:Holliday junction resolvase RusA-like endonuclease
MSEVWKAANKDYWIKWKVKNPDYYKDYRAKHREKHRAYNTKYREENYDKYVMYQAKHQAKKKRIKLELEAKKKAELKVSNSIINLSSNLKDFKIYKPEDITNNLNAIYDKTQNKFVIPVKKI